MKIDFIEEPLLEFGFDRHVDIRYGIQNLNPFDYKDNKRPASIRVGFVGTQQSMTGASAWMESCRSPIAGKESRKTNLFPAFPGFNPDSSFRATFVTDPTVWAAIHPGEFEKLKSNTSYNARIAAAVELFVERIGDLREKRVDVVVCAMPLELITLMAETGGKDSTETTVNLDDEDDVKDTSKHDFHDLLKARSMLTGVPIQVIRPGTWDEKNKRKELDEQSKGRKLQDPATRAWNFFTALYYKAGGIPWRLPRSESDISTCYVGISFYFSLEKDKLLTSIAQVFNERGAGVIVRGKNASRSKTDLQIHLDYDSAKDLLLNALKRYKREHHNLPGRVVLHKTSGFDENEVSGFIAALNELDIDAYDFIYISSSFNRLYRPNYYPPLRGAYLELDGTTALLYTRGSVPFYEEYPGMYVPKTLMIKHERSWADLKDVAGEITALTKMNWNNTQFDNLNPITIRASRQVGSILKYTRPQDQIEHLYKFFM
ncbi:hypothetical protein OPIT5_23245 [Opitutaceae bacterium TAV5]|nr:hypothetical protein OPIT5_23245 [Opitutaceae bacterium TAV5]